MSFFYLSVIIGVRVTRTVERIDMNSINITNDPAFSNLCALSARYPRLVEFAKTAELSPEEFSDLPEGAFAWPEKRAFPIHTKEHAAISTVYARHAESLPDHVQDNLKFACEAYSIPPDVFVEAETKTASDVYWLLPEDKRFRVTSASDVMFAQDALEKRAYVLTEEQRAEAYLNLVKAAEIYGVTVRDEMQKFAGQTLTNTDILSDWLDARGAAARGIGSDKVAVVFESMGETYRNLGQYIALRDDQVKLAQSIDKLDKLAGLEPFIGKSIPNPILTVWNTNKIAAQQLAINGMYFDKNMLASLPLSFWNDALGPDFVSEFAPGGQVDPALLEQVLQTLPADMKATLVTQLSAYAKK